MSICPHLVFRRRLAAVGAAALFALTSARAQIVAPPPPVRPPLLQVQGAERPVRLESLKIDVEIAGGVAETRVEMVFFNPNGRTLEGKLQFPLAPGQVVSGFALDVDGKLRDAVPVDKARGQQVFEEITRRGVDPGLLQTTLGNNHELRLYPLLAGKTRTVMLRLVEPAGQRLRIPLAYAPRVADFAFSVRTVTAGRSPVAEGGADLGLRFEPDRRGGFVARVARRDAALPAEPIAVRLADGGGDAPAITTEQRGGQGWFTLELPVPASRAARLLPRHVQVVWDASASAASRVVDREFALLDAYFARAGDITVHLVRVSDTATAPERFEVRRGDWRALRTALAATACDGASNLGAVRHDGVSTEALWFSDGLANYGTPWRLRFPVPVFAISSAASGDPTALQALADSSGGRRIDLGALTRAAAADALLMRGSTLEAVTAVGARDLVVQSQSAASGRLVLAGAFTASRAEVTVRLGDAAGRVTTRTVAIPAGQNASRLAALQWARLTLASLEGEARTNRVRIREIGRQFGLATGETSLIVLELAADYARYDIEPPPELRAAYEQLRSGAAKQKTQGDAARLAQVVRRFQERADWWRRDFPKGTPPAPLEVAKSSAAGALDALAAAPRQESARAQPAVPSAAPATRSALADTPAGFAARSKSGALREDQEASAPATIRIAIAPAAGGSASIRRLETAPAEERLRIYFDERVAQAGNVGFFLDAADFFIGRGERALGLRVLSNLAEMDLQNRQVLRLLAYRLQQAGEVDLAVPVFERVLELAPHEPQSHRDLGLALAQAGQGQRAIERLYDVVTGAWDARFADIDLIALTELNAIVDKARRDGKPLDVARVEPRLLAALPLDVRVVLSWDADNTDVDLHVIDPNGEEVSYGRSLSYQGGAISRDATGGYGPEEFALRVAKPGKYRIVANFFGHRQQVLATRTGLMLWLSSGFGSAVQKDQRTTISVRSDRGERVVVGEFEVSAR